MRAAELNLPPMEANAMSVPPHGSVPRRPFWDICWRARTALILMTIGCGLQWLLAVLLIHYLTP